MLTNQAIYNDLLGYLGHEPGNGAPDEDQRILQDINAALQDMWTFGPDFLRKTRTLLRYGNPVSVTFGVTQDSNTITGTPFTDKMVGCLIRISGEDVDNEISSPTTLLYAASQATNASVGATIYFDSARLPDNFVGVDGTVFLDDTARELHPLQFQDKTLFKSFPTWAIDPYYTVKAQNYIRSRIGYPEGYYVENVQVNTGNIFGLRMRLWPVPQENHAIKFMAVLGAPQLALADLEIGADTPSKVMPIPGAMHETILLPLAREKLSSYPHFLPSKRDLVVTGKSDAMRSLNAMIPQKQVGAKLRQSVSGPG